MSQGPSPVTGILEEDTVYLDFGEHTGKSILEISDTEPEYYSYLVRKLGEGTCTIKRYKDKSFRLYKSHSFN